MEVGGSASSAAAAKLVWAGATGAVVAKLPVVTAGEAATFGVAEATGLGGTVVEEDAGAEVEAEEEAEAAVVGSKL